MREMSTIQEDLLEEVEGDDSESLGTDTSLNVGDEAADVEAREEAEAVGEEEEEEDEAEYDTDLELEPDSE